MNAPKEPRRVGRFTVPDETPPMSAEQFRRRVAHDSKRSWAYQGRGKSDVLTTAAYLAGLHGEHIVTIDPSASYPVLPLDPEVQAWLEAALDSTPSQDEGPTR